MEIKDIIIAGVVIIVAAIILSNFVFTPASSAKEDTSIQVLNKGAFGEDSTIYIKLTDNNKSALGDKSLHVKLLDSKGKVIYDQTVDTHATGVGMAKLNNISEGKYDLNITFDGDGNYSSCSFSKKVTVKGEHVEDIIDNSTLLDDNDNDDLTDQSGSTQHQSSSSSSSSSSQSSQSQSSPSQQETPSSSDSDDGYDVYIDENGKEMDLVIGEDGKQVDPTTVDLD